MIIHNSIFIILFFFSLNAIGQEIATVKSEVIHSEILNQDREILIYLPFGYNENTYSHYDVIYVFDAQNRELFDYVHSVPGFLNNTGRSFIVVSITSSYYEETDYARNHDMLPPPRYTEPSEFYGGYSGNADNFISFVEKEVINHIESKYRTLGNRLAIGHSLSASLILYSLISKTGLFDDFIAVSPNLAYDKERLAEDLINFNYSKLQSPTFIYTSQANEGINYWKEWKPAFEKVSTFLSDSSRKNIIYYHKSFPDNNHWNTYISSINEGLRLYLDFYSKNYISRLSNETIPLTIQVTVPNKEDSVYITGNQESLANWTPGQILLSHKSDLVREITVKVKIPVEFKITRNKDWMTEAYIRGNEFMGNISIIDKNINTIKLEVLDWNDLME
ncbi:alpha/beta hydrolase [Marinigracilibium pacificum]|uniref:Esterase n=1 Tax=Marinigracilibium pacificum TaxID=2729599 RepID=A0A848J044_9BACT|nr:alpha/beta hydrolase-fold protein [Marinigracilibium pacificum]NMM49917.1 esterase [Marinigracilibium pacificum]